MTDPIKMFFTMMKAVKIVSWLVTVIGLIGLGISAYLYYNNRKAINISSEKQVNQNNMKSKEISFVSRAASGNGLDNEGYDKY